MTDSTQRPLHLGWAEHGKLCTLRGDHLEALRHYQQAMAAAVNAHEPELLVRHYVECSLESLELMGAFEAVLEHCDRTLRHYTEHPPQHPLVRRDEGWVRQRRGVQLLKLGQRDAARSELRKAQEAVVADGGKLSLAATLMLWLQAELTISPERLLEEQQRHGYFSVRKDTTRPALAVALPSDSGQPGSGRRRQTPCSTTK